MNFDEILTNDIDEFEDLLFAMLTIYKCRTSYGNLSFPACDTRLQVRKKDLDNKSKNLEEYYKVNIP